VLLLGFIVSDIGGFGKGIGVLLADELEVVKAGGDEFVAVVVGEEEEVDASLLGEGFEGVEVGVFFEGGEFALAHGEGAVGDGVELGGSPFVGIGVWGGHRVILPSWVSV
jgi:hypothetical protein